MLPVIKGEEYESPVREALVTHSYLGKFAIQQGDWKVIFGKDGGGEKDRTFEPIDLEGDPGGQLYNMKEDPRELDNLWNERQDIVLELTELKIKYEESGRSNY